MNKTRAVQVKGLLVQAIFWASYCAYSSFIVNMLTGYGYPSATATGMMTATSVLSFIAQPVSGYICDNFISHKKVYIALTICALPTMVLLARCLFSPVLTMALMLLFTIFMVQMPGLLDAWIIGLTNRYPGVNYGLCRGSSSLFFAVSAQAMGWITAQYGHAARMWVGAALGLVSVLVALTLEGLPTRREAEKAAGAQDARNPRGLSTGETVKILCRNRCYLLLLGMNFLLFLGYSAVSSFIPVLTAQLGGGSEEVGTVFALNALAEVPAMFLMGAVLRRVAAKKVVLFAAVFFLIRLGLTALSVNFAMMLLVQLLQGLSFAVIWPASMGYLNRIVEEGVRSTAIMTYSSVTLGVSAIFGNLIGTLILSATGDVRVVFGFAAVSAAAGLLLGLYGLARKIWV